MHPCLRLKIIILCCFLSSFGFIRAGKPNIINFYKNNYQAANKNWSIAQDTLGNMYFGNDKGLLEFDGIRWKLYTISKSEVIRSVAVSSDHLIFTGGYEEFGMWKRDASGELVYTSLSDHLKEGLHNDDIWKILITDTSVYFQSFKHIYKYDFNKVSTLNTLEKNILFLINVNDEYWFQEMGGSLFKLNNDIPEEIDCSNILKGTEVRVVLPFQNKQYLIGTSTEGLFVYNGTHFRKWDTEFSQIVSPFDLNHGILGKNGHYFFGTILNGIYEVNSDGKIINHFDTDNFLQNNTVLSLSEDYSGNIWVALDRGISYIQYRNNIDNYTDPLGKIGAVYTAVIQNNNLFIGTNQGVFYIPVDKLQKSESLSDLKFIEGTQGQVWDLQVSGDKLLCGHNKGFKIIDKNFHVSNISEISDGVYTISSMKWNNQNLMFIGTYTSAYIASEDLKSIHKILPIQEPINSIETDHLDNIWLGHANKGVYRCRFTENNEKIKCHSNYEKDATGKRLPYHLRLYKLGGRIVFVGNDTFYTYNDIDDRIVIHKELTRNFSEIKGIKKIIPLTENLYLVINNNCIYKIFYDGYSFKNVDKFDVSYNNLSLVNNYENGVFLNDSLSLICLDNGFLMYDLFESTANPRNLKAPYLRSITTINSKNVRKYLTFTESNQQISFSQNSLIFDFFGQNVFTQNLFFQYQLQGVTTEWSAPAKIHEVLFERLPAGKYTFLLRTVDHLGNYSRPLSFSFEILPPWYFSVLAYLCYILLFCILMIGIWMGVLRRYRNIHLIKVRTREEKRLRNQNLSLQQEIEIKNAELFSQTSFIIQKNELLLKVKKEIDDFYSNYSGNKLLKPLYEKMDNLLNKKMDIEEDWKMFLIQFEQKHTGFFKRMKEIQPDLTPSDLKLCACLKLNLSSKDIASLMNISIRAVENNRYRLRKKLNIPQSQHLADYFMQL